MTRLLTAFLLLSLVPPAGLNGQEKQQNDSVEYLKAARHYQKLADAGQEKLKIVSELKNKLQVEYAQLLELKKRLGEGHPSVKAQLAKLQDREAALVDATGVIDAVMTETDRITSVRHRIQRLADLMNQLSVELTEIRDESTFLENQQPAKLKSAKDFFQSADRTRALSKRFLAELEASTETRLAENMNDLAIERLHEAKRASEKLHLHEAMKKEKAELESAHASKLHDVAVEKIKAANLARHDGNNVAANANDVVHAALQHMAILEREKAAPSERYQKIVDDYTEVKHRLDRIEAMLQKLLEKD